MFQTKSENFTKQANTAVLAIMQHAVDHGFPPILSIDVYQGAQQINVRVQDDDKLWLNSLQVLDEKNEKSERGPSWWRTEWSVQLPATGVVFNLIAYREQPLAAVSA